MSQLRTDNHNNHNWPAAGKDAGLSTTSAPTTTPPATSPMVEAAVVEVIPEGPGDTQTRLETQGSGQKIIIMEGAGVAVGVGVGVVVAQEGFITTQLASFLIIKTLIL